MGNRTVVHHIQAHRCRDDCFEWLGETVSASHLIASACGNDSLDHQLGWTGGVQFGHAFPPVGSLPATHPAADCTAIHSSFIHAPYIGAFAPGGEDWTAGWSDYPLN